MLFTPPFGNAAGALDTGDGWLVLGAGQAPFNFDRAVDMTERGGAPATVLIAEGRTANGGVVGAARRGLAIVVSEAGEPFVRAMLRNAGLGDYAFDVVRERRAIGTGPDRIVLEPIDLPDTPGALILYRPSARWLWIPDGMDPLMVRMALARAEANGWLVDVVGTPREAWEVR